MIPLQHVGGQIARPLVIAASADPSQVVRLMLLEICDVQSGKLAGMQAMRNLLVYTTLSNAVAAPSLMRQPAACSFIEQLQKAKS